MGLFDFMKKPKPKPTVTITTREYTPKELMAQKKLQTAQKIKNFQKDAASLYPYEILMLSYLEKYAAGKEPARFWEYEYGVDNVPALIKSLEKRGFAKNGKLTEAGKQEIKNNEYVLYMHKHKVPEISMADMCILVNKNPGRPYRDLLWGEFNRLSGEYMKSGNMGLYRNIRYTMYRFLFEEKRYEVAFGLLAEVLFYDLNGDQSPFIAPRIAKSFRDLERKTDYTEEKIKQEVFRILNRITHPYKNFSVTDISRIVVAYSFGNEDIAEGIFEKGKSYIKKEAPVFKSILTAEQRRKANIKVK